MPYGHASMLLLGEGSEATEPYNKYDRTRPHCIRSLLFDQKVRLLSFDQKSSTYLQPPSCMYERNIKLSQNNSCGMSNHSQIALNKIINITNLYVLCINETKKDMTSDIFDNYTVLSAINGNNSQDVAMLIHSSLPYLRIYDLENIHFDSIWIVTVLNGKKSCHRHRIYSIQLSRKNATFHKLSRNLEVLLYI